MTALYLAIVSTGIRTNELVTDAKSGGSKLKTGGNVPFAVGEAVSKLKAVIDLDTLDGDVPELVPHGQPPEEVRGGIGALLRVSSEVAQP